MSEVTVQLSSLYLAYKHSYFDVVEFLISEGASWENLMTPLHLAVVLGKLENVEQILQGNMDIDATDCHLRTPLHLACRLGYNDIAVKLIQNGCDLQRPDCEGHTPLALACHAGHPDIAEFLLSYGADVQGYGKHFPLEIACRRGYTDVVTRLLQCAPYALNNCNSDDILMSASRHCHHDIVQTLLLTILKNKAVIGTRLLSDALCAASISKSFRSVSTARNLVTFGADINLRDSKGRLALHCAIVTNNVPLAKFFIDSGAHATAPSAPGFPGRKTALYLACDKQNFEMTRILIDAGAYVNVCSEGTRLGTPLSVACHHGNLDIAKMLLESGAYVNPPLRSGSLHPLPPLMAILDAWFLNMLERKRVTRSRYIGVFQLLQDSFQARVNKMADIYLLEKACQTDDVQLFLNSFQGNNATFIYEDLNGHCVTPLHTAVKFSAVQISRDLLSRGADVNIMDDITGDTPLHVLCKLKGDACDNDVYLYTSETNGFSSNDDVSESILSMLLARNPNMNQMNYQGELPITITSRNNDVMKVCKLLDHDKTQTSLRNGGSFTALHEAIIHVRMETVSVLMEYGADANATCLQEVNTGEFIEMTPLQLAYKHYSKDIFELLLAKGARQVELGPKIHLATFLGETDDVRSLALCESVNIFDEFGRSPLHIACGVKDKGMVELLFELGAIEKRTTDTEQTPFLVACETGSGDVVSCLLRRGLYTDSAILEAIDVTLSRGHVDVLRELLTHGAVGLTDSNVDNLLEMACERQNVDLAKLILGHCRPKTRVVVDMKTLSNCLCMACERGNRDLVRCLVKYGANVNSRNAKNRYPLHCAMMQGHTKLVSELIDLGARVTSPMGPGYHGDRTALYLLCDRGDIEMASILIRGGASVNIPSDTRPGTPLNSAVYKNNMPIAKLLLEAGACVNARSPRRGWSPINTLLQAWVSNITEGKETEPSEYFETLQLLDDYCVSYNDLYTDDLIQQIYVMDRVSCLRLLQMACGKLQKVNASLLTSMLQNCDLEGLAALTAAGYTILEKVNRLCLENPDCPRLDAMSLEAKDAMTLQSLCRLSVRRHLHSLRGHVRFQVQELPLPNRLKSYLNMDF
ncbi:ankyrin-3-like [Lineus longissimus]|uniref:ankyrin-3-like n=1 Tax=Lineus longissimus TaxID=88925 RepID=UPI00315C9FE9